jgi:hypothetical protein
MPTYYKPGPNGTYIPVTGDEQQKAGNDALANSVLNKIIGGAENMPTFSSLIDPATGQLKSGYSLGAPGANEATSYMKDIATAQGPSQWGQLMQQLIGGQRTEALDKAAATGNAATGRAMSDLAMRGGASKAARERIATKGAVSDVLNRQSVNRNADQSELDMLAKDESNKMGMLNSWAGLNESALNRNLDVERTNLNTRLADKQAGDTFNMNKWQESMKTLGSYQTSRAQEEAGKK